MSLDPRDPGDDTQDKVDAVTLERVLTLAIRKEWPRDLPRGVTVEVMANRLIGGVAVELRTYILGLEDSTHTTDGPTEPFPVSWWQHCRQRWFPAWWLRRHPVKVRRVGLSITEKHYRVCPHIELPAGDQRHITFFRSAPSARTPRDAS